MLHYLSKEQVVIIERLRDMGFPFSRGLRSLSSELSVSNVFLRVGEMLIESIERKASLDEEIVGLAAEYVSSFMSLAPDIDWLEQRAAKAGFNTVRSHVDIAVILSCTDPSSRVSYYRFLGELAMVLVPKGLSLFVTVTAEEMNRLRCGRDCDD